MSIDGDGNILEIDDVATFPLSDYLEDLTEYAQDDQFCLLSGSLLILGLP